MSTLLHAGVIAVGPMDHSPLPFSSLACSSAGKRVSMTTQAEESLNVSLYICVIQDSASSGWTLENKCVFQGGQV